MSEITVETRQTRPRQQRRRTQTERSEEMRLRLLEAAADVLRRRGIAGLRTAEVSEVAGVSRGAQLHHFPSKDSLVLATTEHIFAQVLKRSVQRAKRAARIGDPIELIIRDSMDFFFGDDFFTILDIVIMGGKTQRFREKIFKIARDYRTPAEQGWLEVLLASGVAERDAREILWLTVSIVRGLAIRSLWQNDQKLFRQLLDAWKAMVAQRLAGARNGKAVH